MYPGPEELSKVFRRSVSVFKGSGGSQSSRAARGWLTLEKKGEISRGLARFAWLYAPRKELGKVVDLPPVWKRPSAVTSHGSCEEGGRDEVGKVSRDELV